MKLKTMRIRMKGGLLEYAESDSDRKPRSEVTQKNLSLLSRLWSVI